MSLRASYVTLCMPYLKLLLIATDFDENYSSDLVQLSLVIKHSINLLVSFQVTSPKFLSFQVTNYLLDTSRLYDDDQTYKASLDIEPKVSRISMASAATGPT